LQTYTGKALMDKYDVYQHLMNYWNEVMQDDCYLIAVDGWKINEQLTMDNEQFKKGKGLRNYQLSILNFQLIIDRYFLTEKKAIEQLEASKEGIATQLTELEEEHNTEEGYFADLDKVNKASVNGQLKIDNGQLKSVENGKLKIDNEELKFLKAKIAVCIQYLKLVDDQTELNKKIKEAITNLDTKVIERYKTLTETEIKQLVVDDKWMASIERSVKTEMERISQRLTQRIKELAERYETTLPKQTIEVAEFEEKVNAHLQKMGFVWN
jgi:type I restriction enzyme M protein